MIPMKTFSFRAKCAALCSVCIYGVIKHFQNNKEAPNMLKIYDYYKWYKF